MLVTLVVPCLDYLNVPGSLMRVTLVVPCLDYLKGLDYLMVLSLAYGLHLWVDMVYNFGSVRLIAACFALL